MRSSKPNEAKSGIVLYTDGSCAPTNPGPGGWAYLTVVNGEPGELVKGGEFRSTNNRMELTAAIEALMTRNSGESVELFTDSEYLRLGITQWMDAWIRNGWMRRRGKPVLNKDLWIALHSQNSRLTVKWQWVKAHAGHPFNELVDEAARDAAIEAASRADLQVPDRTPSTPAATPFDSSYFVAAVNSGASSSAWAVTDEISGGKTVLDGIEERTSVNRALLTGVVALMRSLQRNGRVQISTDSEYLYRGATQWLASWKRRTWRKADGKPVANKDLWIEIDMQLERVDVEWRLDRGSNDASSVA